MRIVSTGELAPGSVHPTNPTSCLFTDKIPRWPTPYFDISSSTAEPSLRSRPPGASPAPLTQLEVLLAALRAVAGAQPLARPPLRQLLRSKELVARLRHGNPGNLVLPLGLPPGREEEGREGREGEEVRKGWKEQSARVGIVRADRRNLGGGVRLNARVGNSLCSVPVAAVSKTGRAGVKLLWHRCLQPLVVAPAIANIFHAEASNAQANTCLRISASSTASGGSESRGMRQLNKSMIFLLEHECARVGIMPFWSPKIAAPCQACCH